MQKLRNLIYNEIDNLVNLVKAFVVENGGFINTQNINHENDQIYAYIVDWGADNVDEYKVIALREKDNMLELAISPTTLNYDEGLTLEDFREEDWYVIGSCGDSVLTAQTILSIADSIEQYV